MKRKVARLRLSPNEEARIIREEYDRRRKLRLQQVREQQRQIALHIRREVEQRRQQEVERLEKELREEWERQHGEKLNNLRQLYQESLQLLGQGHRDAKENEPDFAAIARKEAENHTKAQERYREALKELKSQRLKDHERQSWNINARKKALQAEKERSAKVASLPLPPHPIQNIDTKKPHVVKKTDVSAFATTHYHMPEGTVDREGDSKQPNAQEGAELEVRRLEEIQKEEKRRREDQLEKARLRGMQAMRREHLTQDHERLLVELEHMQQADRLRKRQQVSKMPPEFVQPFYRRQEAREDYQREMEFAFEDMYTGERRDKGDVLVQLIPEPLPALSTSSQDQELNVTLDEIPTHETENTHHETQQGSPRTEQETSAQVKPSKPAPRRTLKKLLDRIRSQRNEWTEQSQISAAEPPAVITNEIPEHDTSIDTGSLTSEEKNKLFTSKPHFPLELKTTKQSTAAISQPPDGSTNRMEDFTKEQKKRQEELERQKQGQVALLQELEEQKVKLEQMLLEAQQERERLKAAVQARDQQVRSSQPEVPVLEATSVTPGPATEVLPASGGDDHTRRIQEYQQRLLEQNRIHRRTVEVARQRLEEYKRALQLRYNMATRTLRPPHIIPQPLHSMQSAFPPAAVQHPITPAAPDHINIRQQRPVEIPIRESDRLTSPAHPLGASSRLSARLVQDEEDLFSHSIYNQSPDASAFLTDDIMERVTKHLPERVRPFTITREPPPYKPTTTQRSVSTQLQSAADVIQNTSQNVTDGEHMGLGGESLKTVTSPHSSVLTKSSHSKDENMETQRHELREAQRQVMVQREAVLLQQRENEEKRQRQEVEMEQMRQQRETLQALIHTDSQPQPVPEATAEVPESVGQIRRKLLASLLRAIEESSGGSLSHLEEPSESEGSYSSQQNAPDTYETDPIFHSDLPAGPSSVFAHPTGSVPSPPRAVKPPVTRIRLGAMEKMTQQHELSAIQEVDTPVNISQVTGLEDSVRVPSHPADWDPLEESKPAVTSDGTLQSNYWSNRGQQIAESLTSVGLGLGRSSHSILKDRWQMEAGSSPDPSEAESRKLSSLSSDSGRGADYSGPAFTSCRSPMESAQRTHDSDCLSSITTISTGSYVTTDPEQKQNTDISLRRCVEGQGAVFLDVSSPSSPSVLTEERSTTESPSRAVASLFSDSSIQNIVDRYTRELNISLRGTGRTTDSGGLHVEDSGSSVSQESLVSHSERTGAAQISTESPSPPSDTAGTQRSGLQRESPVNPVLEPFSHANTSQAEGQEQDSFRPLIGYISDQSSFLPADHRDLAMEQLVGQPSAHSSVIGQLPGLPVSSSRVQSEWDSTLNRMIGQLTQHSSCRWLSGGQDQLYAGQLASEPRTTWLDEVPEESLMVPLVGEPDESAGQVSGSSGERTRTDLGVALHPALPPEASSHAASIQSLNPQDHPNPSEPDPQSIDASQSFHQLFAELTHNETADPSMTFHLPQQNVPKSPEEQPAGFHSSASESHEGSSQFELSPERLRIEEPTCCMTASPGSHESFSQLIISQQQSHDSVLIMSPTMKTDVESAALNLSKLTMCGDSHAVSMAKLEEPFKDLSAGELKCELGLSLNNALTVSEKVMEAAGEKGILEQSQITLVSLTDTTLQDPETTITEGGEWEDKHPDGKKEERQKDQETQGTDSALLPDKTLVDRNQTEPVKFLEFHWGPCGDQQDVCLEKRRDLLQRSLLRVEEIKARRAQGKSQSDVRIPSKAREQSKVKDHHPAVTHEEKPEPQKQKCNIQSKSGSAEQAGFIKQKKAQPSNRVGYSRLSRVDDIKICTTEQRKLAVTEMHQRTQRLYDQLEEVKQQRVMRNRQESYAQNRIKAKEFHKKTLQKLRGKQTLQ